MEVEGRNSIQPAGCIQVLVGVQRRNLVGSVDHSGAEPILVFDWNV